MAKEDASPVRLGEGKFSKSAYDLQSIFHSSGIKSCQLVMGLTMQNRAIYGTLCRLIPIAEAEVGFILT